VALTFSVAALLGFESQGSIWLAVALGTFAGAGCVGLGMAVASVSRSVARAFVLSSVVMFLLMLFSGVVFPVPAVVWVEVAGHGLGPFSLLPTTHAAQALRKVLLLGQGLPQVAFEVAMMLALSLLGLAAGAALWTWRHGRAAHTRGVR
jgi:ABC-type polysaccharide/polyol phosphate export permease